MTCRCSNCDSSSYSYARFSSANIFFLTFSASNSACPTPALPTVTISGSTYEYIWNNNCVSRTWTASGSNGTSPYTYQWYFNGAAVGTGGSYTAWICGGHAPGFTLSVTLTDSASHTASDSHYVAVDYYQEPMCGDYIC